MILYFKLVSWILCFIWELQVEIKQISFLYEVKFVLWRGIIFQNFFYIDRKLILEWCQRSGKDNSLGNIKEISEICVFVFEVKVFRCYWMRKRVIEIFCVFGKIMYIQKFLQWEMNLDFVLKM